MTGAQWIHVTVITNAIEMVSGKLPVLLRKEDKFNMKGNLNFVSQEQLDADMRELLQHYGANESQANLDKTRKILKRFGTVNEELVAMRDENR
jgi:hypothetical protein